MVANRCSVQVRQQKFEPSTTRGFLMNGRCCELVLGDFSQKSVLLYICLQVSSLSPQFLLMSRIICTLPKRSRSAQSWSFPSSRVGKLNPKSLWTSNIWHYYNGDCNCLLFMFLNVFCLVYNFLQWPGWCTEESQCYRVWVGIWCFHTRHQQSSVCEWQARCWYCVY